MTLINTCRFCQYYAPAGRRAGDCTKLKVTVEGDWEACPLAEHPFADRWDEAVPILTEVRRHQPDYETTANVGNL
jgi:hypothetical protein